MNHKNRFITDDIPSPYNFVPLSDTIVEADWAKDVSHDLPFKDGVSCEIGLKIETKSPIYIRNGGNWNSDDRLDAASPMQDSFQSRIGPNGQDVCIIPGTSLKGTIRNVLEIASFGKMNKIADNRYSIRDLYYSKYTSKMTSKEGAVIHTTVNTGWLECKNNKWAITPCEHARVECLDLKNFHGGNPNIGAKQSAVKKYEKWKGTSLNIDFSFEPGPHTHSCGKMQYTKATNLKTGTQGTIVFTGQASVRGKDRNGNLVGKHMEFVFHTSGKQCEFVEHLRNDFEFIHSNERNEPNEEWAYWKDELRNGEQVPVFYLKDKLGHIESMGLAMMYRLPYKNSIADTVRHTSMEHFYRQGEKIKYDMADVLFGNILDSDRALKGRVHFSHLRETEESKQKRGKVDIQRTVLGSPKPTFYPNYIKQKANSQNKVSQYLTYMDDSAEVSGWKRYPVESREVTYQPIPRTSNGNENLEVASMFKPLPSGSIFTGKIRVHNLIPVELGALLWALKWGNNDHCRHQVGMGKALGQGAISIEIDNDKLNSIHDCPESIQFYIRKFEEFMTSKVPGWKDSEQLRELLTMADISKKSKNGLECPILSTTHPNQNDFASIKHKDAKKSLGKYSRHIEEIKIFTNEEIKEKEWINEKRKSLKSNPVIERILSLKNPELKAFINEISSDSIDDAEAFIAAYPILYSGAQKEVRKAFKKGKGGLFKQLLLIQEITGKLIQ